MLNIDAEVALMPRIDQFVVNDGHASHCHRHVIDVLPFYRHDQLSACTRDRWHSDIDAPHDALSAMRE